MNNLLKKVFEVNFFFVNVVAPVIGLTLYCWSFAYVSSYFMLEGVNYVFASKLGKYATIFAVCVILIFLTILMTHKNDNVISRNVNQNMYFSDLFLILLPLTPITQYLLSNMDIVTFNEILYILGIFLSFSVIYIYVFPVILYSFFSIRALMLIGLSFVFTVSNMASLTDYFAWFEKGSFLIQFLFFGSVFIILSLLYHFDQRNILYLFIVISLVSNIFYQLSQRNNLNSLIDEFEDNRLLPLVEKKVPAKTPNIYLLVYDAYVPNETMLAYNIDNSDQEKLLQEKGFQLYPHTYSIGSSTIDSMSKVFNVSNEYYVNKRKGVSGDGVTHAILKHLEYRTYGLFYSDFMFRGYGDNYDYSIPASTIPSYIQISKALFMGEFRFDIETIGFSKQSRDEFVEGKRIVFESITSKTFIYMHTNLPAHSQNSGACLSNETELYKERLESANLEMTQDINLIINNDPQAIIIVAGDHGPYLTKNCIQTTGYYDISEISRLDIQDRYATFLAIRWPTGDFIHYDDIVILQDLFPAVFAYIYEDPTILESKIKPRIPMTNNTISNASVRNGRIEGGINDGEPLFLSDE